MGPMGCPETSAHNYQHTGRNNPEDRRPHLHRGGSLKSRNHSCRCSDDSVVCKSGMPYVGKSLGHALRSSGLRLVTFCANGTDFLPIYCCVLLETYTSPLNKAAVQCIQLLATMVCDPLAAVKCKMLSASLKFRLGKIINVTDVSEELTVS
jgi:hypothetical protein